MIHQEWQLLQQQYETYERWALVIKLVAVIIALVVAVISLNKGVGAVLVMVLWGQEAIWKTYQARLGDRILVLEASIKNSDATQACQLHSEWLNQRPGTLGLVLEYAKNGLRPTVAYPYVFLLLCVWIFS